MRMRLMLTYKSSELPLATLTLKRQPYKVVKHTQKIRRQQQTEAETRSLS